MISYTVPLIISKSTYTPPRTPFSFLVLMTNFHQRCHLIDFYRLLLSHAYLKCLYPNERALVMLRIFSIHLRVLHIYLLYKFLSFYGYDY